VGDRHRGDRGVSMLGLWPVLLAILRTVPRQVWIALGVLVAIALAVRGIQMAIEAHDNGIRKTAVDERDAVWKAREKEANDRYNAQLDKLYAKLDVADAQLRKVTADAAAKLARERALLTNDSAPSRRKGAPMSPRLLSMLAISLAASSCNSMPEPVQPTANPTQLRAVKPPPDPDPSLRMAAPVSPSIDMPPPSKPPSGPSALAGARSTAGRPITET
jgi:hypothetical protein